MTCRDIGIEGDPLIPANAVSARWVDFEVLAGGSDPGGNEDRYDFVFEPRTGDFDVQGRVESFVSGYPFSKTGLTAYKG